MVEIIITAKTPKGEKAIKQHYKESQRMKFKQRLVFKALGYKQKLISEKPYTLVLDANNKFIKGNPMFFNSLLFEIEKTLKSNGAEKEKDYTMEVIG